MMANLTKNDIKKMIIGNKPKKLKVTAKHAIPPFSICQYGQCRCGQIWSEVEQRPVMKLLHQGDPQDVNDWADVVTLPTQDEMTATARFVMKALNNYYPMQKEIRRLKRQLSGGCQP